MIDQEFLLQILLFALFGLCLGSFATALIYRIPRHISWICGNKEEAIDDKAAARSQCPNCHAVLKTFDLIPLLSWLFLFGKCRYCKQKISVFYPAIEAIVMLAVVGIFLTWPHSLVLAVVVSLYIPFLMASFFVSLKGMAIPNDVIFSFLVISLLFLMLNLDVSKPNPDWAFFQNHALAGLFLPLIVWGGFYGIGKLRKDYIFDLGILGMTASFGLFLGVEYLASFLGFSLVFGVFSYFFLKKPSKNPLVLAHYGLTISFFVHLFLTGIGFYSRV